MGVPVTTDLPVFERVAMASPIMLFGMSVADSPPAFLKPMGVLMFFPPAWISGRQIDLHVQFSR